MTLKEYEAMQVGKAYPIWEKWAIRLFYVGLIGAWAVIRWGVRI